MDPPGIEPGFPACRAGVVPLDHQPVFVQWTGWESNPPHRPCKGQSPPREHASPQIQRSVRESNPVFLLTEEVCCRNTYRPSSTVIPDWNRTSTFLVVTQASSPLDHGICSSDRGGSRTHRHEALDLAAMPICVPGRKWRVRESHPAVQAYETRLSLRPPAVAGPGIEPGAPALWEPVGHLPRLQCVSDHGESRTPMPARARRSDRRVSTSSTTWSCSRAARAGIEPAFPA